jgi:hypothetical protein
MTIQEKRQHLHMLLVHNHMIAAKEHVLAAYGVERMRDLSEQQLDELMQRIANIAEQKQNENEIKHWRHLCLKAMSSFIDTNDWNRVNAFMLSKRVAGKHMYECSVDELKILHRKIKNIAKVVADKALREKQLALKN